ncbi:hypothetical protein K474DRAFT_1597837 [Panus rudis PR-1116 ss-1]|nr:hypothetical protein K474DRAFT_1597837 [Panus rudis PR-1116 ss-1]
MLRRTQTDSSLPDSTSKPTRLESHSRSLPGPSTPPRLTASRTESFLQASPSCPSHPLTPSKSKSMEDVSSPARPSLATTSNIRTYGGKSRSFLIAIPTSQSGALSQYGAGSQSLGFPGDDPLLGESQEEDLEIRESYSELRARWGVDNSDYDPWPTATSPQDSPGEKSKRKGKGKQSMPPAPRLPEGMMNDLKSISELRSKGESRRFLDDVGYLFEGLDPGGGIGVRRTSAMEIVTKLCDDDFARKAKAADFLGRAWECLREAGAGDGDKVLDTILAFYAALVSRDPRDLPELASKSGFTAVLFKLLGSLDRTNDPLWLISSQQSDSELKRSGVSKLEKNMLQNIHRLARKKSGLFEEDEIISTRLLISYTLAALPPSSHSTAHLPQLLASLTNELEHIPTRISSYTSGLSLLPPFSAETQTYTPSFLHVDNCLRLLDSYLLGRWKEKRKDRGRLEHSDENEEKGEVDLRGEGSAVTERLSETLMSLYVAVDILSREGERPSIDCIAYKCLETTLRILINLTHDNQLWCQYVLDHPMALQTILRVITISHKQRAANTVKKEPDAMTDVEDEEGDSTAPILDRLCLALGLLTNIAQVNHELKAILRETTLNPNCRGKRVCLEKCRCSSNTNALITLTRIYVDHTHSDEDVVEVTVRGHMAILLGLLMRGDSENQEIILNALPGPEKAKKQKLNGIVENAREFAVFYAEFSKKVAEASQGADLEREDDDVVGRDDEDDEVVVGDSSVGKVLHDTQGESVARDVIAYLEELRDRA